MKNILRILFLILFTVFSFVFFSKSYEAQQTKLKAKAILYNPLGKKVGVVLFKQETSAVRIMVDIKNLQSGIHAFHIHEHGKCDFPDFQTSGGHFNPLNKEHGFLNPKGPHAGDLPNLEVNKNGTAYVEFETGLVTLKLNAKNSLLNKNGTSVIIHENPDDYLTNPAGKGGKRIACGIIKEEME
ncbi:MAG TPA: superoxide dismutase [Elusimicrobia bacterium]|nr:MAG: hypothetical protein A2551_06485 [Elusimicrobia bacterium RIFOXYD2_FULL_34_30]HAM39483.1 superoxide dismutase [Elusimicrobiota bacterium]